MPKTEFTNTTHSFRVDLAVQYGVPAAIMLGHIYFWVSNYIRNKDTKKMRGNKYWTYGSRSYFAQCYPYYSGATWSKALQKLEDLNLVEATCTMNRLKYDHTKSYTLTDEGWQKMMSVDTSNDTICSPDINQQSTANNQQSYDSIEQHSAKCQHTSDIIKQTIPNQSTNLDTNYNPTIIIDSTSDDTDYCITLYRDVINPNITKRDIFDLKKLINIYGSTIVAQSIHKMSAHNGKSTKYLAKVASSIQVQPHNDITSNADKLLHYLGLSEEDNSGY